MHLYARVSKTNRAFTSTLSIKVAFCFLDFFFQNHFSYRKWESSSYLHLPEVGSCSWKYWLPSKKGSGQSGQMMRSSSFPVSQRKEGRVMPVKLQNQRCNNAYCKTLKTITNIHWLSVNCMRNAYGHSFNDTQYSRTNKLKQPSMCYHFLLCTTSGNANVAKQDIIEQ